LLINKVIIFLKISFSIHCIRGILVLYPLIRLLLIYDENFINEWMLFLSAFAISIIFIDFGESRLAYRDLSLDDVKDTYHIYDIFKRYSVRCISAFFLILFFYNLFPIIHIKLLLLALFLGFFESLLIALLTICRSKNMLQQGFIMRLYQFISFILLLIITDYICQQSLIIIITCLIVNMSILFIFVSNRLSSQIGLIRGGRVLNNKFIFFADFSNWTRSGSIPLVTNIVYTPYLNIVSETSIFLQIGLALNTSLSFYFSNTILNNYRKNQNCKNKFIFLVWSSISLITYIIMFVFQYTILDSKISILIPILYLSNFMMTIISIFSVSYVYLKQFKRIFINQLKALLITFLLLICSLFIEGNIYLLSMIFIIPNLILLIIMIIERKLL